MKKLRRSLALLLIAAILVNSTDFSLLTVNAEEQTATEGKAPSGNNESSEEQDAEAQSSETENTDAEGEEAAPPEDGSGDAAGPAEGQDGSDGTVSQPGTGETGDPAGQPGTGETDGSAGQPADDGSEGIENSGSDGAEYPPASDEDQGTNGEPGSGENPGTPSDDGESEDAQDGTPDADMPSGEEQVPAVPGAEQPADPDQVLPPANLAPSLPGETDEETVPTIIGVDFTDEDKAAYVQNQTVPIGAALDAVRLPGTVIGIVDAADGADGEEAADETIELTVSEWVITGPEGATEFDTSASEEDENVPKQGFYEFAPVLADLPEGYEWSETVPDGYDTWDEYLENWMKISVTVGAENAVLRAGEVASAGTFSINVNLLRESGYLAVPDGEENAGSYFAYYNSDSGELTLLADNATYIFDGSVGSTFNVAVKFANGDGVGDESVNADVNSTTIRLSQATINGNNGQQSTIDFTGLENAKIEAIGDASCGISEPYGMHPAIQTNGCDITISAGSELNVTSIDNDGKLVIQSGKISMPDVCDTVINNTGEIIISGQSELVISAGRKTAISGGSISVEDTSRFYAYGMNSSSLFNANGNGLFCGEMKAPIPSGTTLTISGGDQVYECYFDDTAAAFITNLPTDGTTAYTITGNSGGRDFKYVGKKDGNGEDTSSFIIEETGITRYTQIRQIYSPVFWQAHAERVTFDSAVLVSEVDTNHTFSGGGNNFGDQPHTWQGFQLYDIWTSDESGEKIEQVPAVKWNTAFEDGKYQTIFGKETTYPAGLAEEGTTYTCEITSLKQGYIYYFIPRIVTTAGVETPITKLGAEGGLEQADPVTGSQSHIIEVRPFYLNWPDTINFTYGEEIGDINVVSQMSTHHPSLTMSKDGEAVTSGNLIPDNQGLTGKFYVYRSENAAVSEDALKSIVEGQEIWDAGTYNTGSGENQAWITFVPENTKEFGLVSQSVTVYVAKRSVTISSVPNIEKEYDGTREINVGNISLDSNIIPLSTGTESIENCTSIKSTMQSDGVMIVQQDSADGLAANFGDKNAGTQKDIIIAGLSVTTTAEGKASNYTVESSITLEGIGTITKRAMTIEPVDETIQTGEDLPSFALQVANEKEWGEGDSLETVLGNAGATVENYPDGGYEESVILPDGEAIFNVKPDLQEEYDNYSFTAQNGTLTVIQRNGNEHYKINQTKNAEGWYKDESVVIEPQGKEGCEYDQIRIGKKGDDGSIVWGNWQGSYSYSESQSGLVVQSKNSQTGAFTSYVDLPDLKIDSAAPEIVSVSYEDGSQNPIGQFINFATFGNFFKDQVVVKVTLKDNLSGPAKLEYAFGSDRYQDASFNSEKNTATFEIPLEDVQDDSSSTVTIGLKIWDKAGNSTAANLIKEDRNPLDSNSWTIDKTLPQISVTVNGTSQTGADGQIWYTSDVTLSVGIKDSDALWKLEEQAGEDSAYKGVWEANTQGPDASAAKEYTYTTPAITENTNGTQYSYKVYDLATNVVPSGSVVVRIDKDFPAITDAKVTPGDFFNDNTNAVISFTATDEGSDIHTVDVARVKDAVGGSIEMPQYSDATSGENGEYSFTDITAAGTYQIRVVDCAGNTMTKEIEVKLDTVNPVISDITGISDNDAWSGADVILTVSANDASATADSVMSGLAELQYKYSNDNEWQTVTWADGADSSQVKIDRNGENRIIFRVLDKAGNVSEEKNVTVKIDKTEPKFDVSAVISDSSESYESGIPTNQPVDFQLKVANKEDISSELTYWVRKGNGEWTEISIFVAQNSTGYSWDEENCIFTIGEPTGNQDFAVDDTFQFKVTTESGKETEDDIWNVKISIVDLAEPVITIENPQGGSGYYNENNTTPLKLHISKVENKVDNSAEISTKYKWWKHEEGEPEIQTGEVEDAQGTDLQFTKSGTYTVIAWAEDTAGNSSDEVKKENIKIDAVEPAFGTITYNDKNNTEFAKFINSLTFGIFFNESVKVTVAASDDYSGVGQLKYQIGGGKLENATQNTDTFTFTLEKDKVSRAVIKMYLYDMADNEASQNLGVDLSSENEPVWTLESEEPVITDVEVDGTSIEEQKDIWHNKAVTVTATVKDEKSGLKEIRYNFGGEDQSYTEGFDEIQTFGHAFSAEASAEGSNTVWIEAEDLAGNQIERITGTIKIDTEGPKIGEVTYTPDTEWTNGNLTATFTVTDPGKNGDNIATSGVDTVTVERIADGYGAPLSETENIDVTDSGNGSYSYTVEKIGTYRITATDKARNVTHSESLKITNIDKLPPQEQIEGEGLQIPDGLDQVNGVYAVDVPVYIRVYDPERDGNSAMSGIEKFEYSYNYADATSEQQPVTGTVRWNPDGDNTVTLTKTGKFILKVTVYDNAGNTLELESDAISINNGKYSLDVTAEKVDGTTETPYTDNTWSNADKIVYTLNLAGGELEVQEGDRPRYWVQTEDSSNFMELGETTPGWNADAKTYTVSEEGIHSLTFRVTNANNANANDTSEYTCKIDRITPDNVEAKAVGTLGKNNWYTGGEESNAFPGVFLTKLPQEDETVNKAPVRTEYKIWSGNTEPGDWTEYTENKSADSTLNNLIQQDGIYTFQWRVADEAGNVSESESITVNVDTTPGGITAIQVKTADPSILDIISNAFGNFTNQKLQITITAEDGTSGLDQLEYVIEGKDPVSVKFDGSGQAVFTVDPASTPLYSKGITVSVIDKAGNESTPEPIEQGEGENKGKWTVESMGPGLDKFTVSNAEGNDRWHITSPTFSWKVSDNGGLSEVKITKSAGTGTEDTEWYSWKPESENVENADIQGIIGQVGEQTVDSADQGTFTFTLSAKDMAGNESVSPKKITVKIDTVAPVIGKPELVSATPADNWTNQDRTYQFTLTDVTSGIDPETVQITCSDPSAGTITATEVNEAPGTWEFNAPVNGIYTISVKDKAGNEAESVEITAEKIDKDAPEGATVTLIPGSPNGSGWYTQTDKANALVSPVAQNEGQSANHTYYILQKDGESAAPEIEVTENNTHVTIESGSWTLTVLTRDDAGNECAEEDKIVKNIRVDNELPEIDTEGITFTNEKNNTLENAIHWLSFGNFFNEAVKVTVPVSDQVSHLKSFWYQIGDDTAKEKPIDGNLEKAVVSFTIPVQKENIKTQEVKIWVEDVAGNTSDQNVRLTGKGTSDDWMIEQDAPTLKVEVDDYNGVYNDDTGWYLGEIRLKGTAQDTDSGLNQVIWKRTVKANESAKPEPKDVTALLSPGAGRITMEQQYELSLSDGIHEVSLWARDNSTNENSLNPVTYKVDGTKPTLSVTLENSSDVPIETPINEPQSIDIKVSDATSGIKEGSLSVSYVDEDGVTHKLNRYENAGDNQDDGYVIVDKLQKAHFYAMYKGTYTITITDNAGNTTSYSFNNNMVDVIQGNEEVTVNNIPAVSTETRSPWYRDVPLIKITSKSNDTAAVKTYYYLANPVEDELLGSDESVIMKDSVFDNVQINDKLANERVKFFEVSAAEGTKTEPVNKNDFLVNGENRDGVYILYAQSIDEAGSIGNMTKYYMRIDRGDPEITKIQGADSTEWAKERIITFEARDVPANGAGTDVSGIRTLPLGPGRNVVVTSPTNVETVYTVTGTDPFEYTATENGTYTITVSDNINAMDEDGKTPQERHTVTHTFTITNIDTTVPENAVISLEDATEGNTVEENLWYKATEPTIVITPPDQPMETEGDASPITTRYTITCNGTVMASGEIKPDGTAFTYEVNENGVWKITTWTVDEAGNVSSPKEQEVTYHIDTAAPTVNVEGISIERVENNKIEDIIHTLTFGVFFKEGIRITVPVNEATKYESGVKTLWYKLNDDTEQEAKSNGDGTFSFTINEQFSGTIDLITEDNAGNKGSGVRMYNNIVGGNESEDTWVVDLEKPVIRVTSDAEKSDYGWYKADVELTVTVDGGTGKNVSGVNNITWTLQKEGAGVEMQTDLYSNPTQIEQSVTEKTTLEKELNGKYTAVFRAEDNAKNVAEPVTQQYWIDSEMPKISDIQNPSDWAQEKTIEFTLSDGVSGIREDSIEVVLVNNDGTETEQTVTKTANNVLVKADTDAGLGAVAGSYTCSFTVQTNGTYKVTFHDAADNEFIQKIAVSKIDRTVPENPTIHVNNSADIAGWYKGNSYPEVSGVKNAQGDESANIAPVRTMYQMWNTETDSEPEVSELIGEGNEHTAAKAPELTKDGMWKVVMWNVDAAGNESEKVEATFGVDTVIPVITDQTVEPSAFVQRMDAEFTLEDPKKEVDGHGESSGIDVSSLTVIFDPEGNGEAYEVDAADIRYEEGVYRIDTTVNGTYTINVKDTAGNSAREVLITLNKISSVRPSNVDLEIQGTKGIREEAETGWYLYDIEKGGVNLHFTTLTPPGKGVRVDVKYLLWKDGEEKPSDESAVVTQTQGAGVTIDRLIDEGGIWNLEYWTVSESGLESESRGTATIKYDPEDSRILTSEIEYTDVNDNPIAHLINWLTFGTFFNEAVKVEIPVEDDFSGAVQLRYQIGGGAEQTEVITEGRTSFEIPLGTKGQIILNVADAAGNVSDNYIMRNLNGEETAWVLENNLPTAQSLNPSLNATGVAVMGEDALTEIELSFSERVVWKEGGQLTISTGEKTYTATMHEDEIPLIPDEGEACTASVPIERFVDENGEPLKLELNEIYTLVVKAGAFMDYATNENEEALLSAFQTGQELDPGEETPLSNLGLELSEGVTMFPAFDPETTGYTLIIGEEAMDGNHLAQDMVFSPILKGDANIEEAVLTDMMGRELASYEIGADGSFTVPKEAIEEHKNYFIRMTASRYGIETVYNFLVSTSAYNEVITLATSDMSAIEVDGLRNTVDVAEETVEGNKVVVQFVASIPREETTAQQLDPIRAVAGDEKGYYSLDLAINKFRSDGVSEELHELDMPVRITVELPDELLGKDTYEVYRNHEGAVDRLDCTLSADGKRLSFESDRFSFYTIAYTPYTPESTGDNGGSGGGTTTETVYVQVPGGTVTETVYITSGGGRPGSGTVTTVPVTDGSADTEEIPASSPRTDEEPDQTAETEEEETKVTSQEDVLAGIPQGLALADLACMVASMMLAEYSYCKQKKLRKILGTIFAAALIILFFLTQPLEGLIAWTDRWTIFFVITAAVHAIVTVIPQRKDKDGDGEDGQDGANPAEG